MTKNPTPSAALSWLRSLGYEVHFRVATWTEVLVTHEQERWWGRGQDEQGALDHAALGMLPSRASRVLLAEFLGRGNPEPQAPRQAAAVHVAPVAAEVVSPTVTEQVDASPASQPDSEPVQAHAVDVESPPVATTTDLPTSAETPSITEDLEQATADLLQHLQGMEGELALCSAEMQRVVLVEWISSCRVLEVQGAATNTLRMARNVVDRASRRWWPGTMPVLRHTGGLAEARQQLLDLDVGPVEVPRDWKHAEQLAVDVRERLEATYAFEGREPSGYRKSSGVHPKRDSANARLEKTKLAVDQLTVVDSAAKELERAALNLRWIRTQVDDPVKWAEAFGKLRALLHKNPGVAWLRHALRWLDPNTVPAKGFALELGIDPEARARGRRRKELVKELGTVVRHDHSALASWFERAAAAGFTAEQLSELLRPGHLVGLQGIGEEQFSDRSTRRKLRKVLANPGPADCEIVQPDTAGQDLDDDVIEADPVLPLPGEERARESLEGKRCILVTNRPEQELCDDLAIRTGMDVTFCVNQTRKLDAVANSIKSGGIAVVLLVTSFIGHDADAKLKEACRRGAAKLLRVRKGKVRVLIEELVLHVNGSGFCEQAAA